MSRSILQARWRTTQSEVEALTIAPSHTMAEPGGGCTAVTVKVTVPLRRTFASGIRAMPAASVGASVRPRICPVHSPVTTADATGVPASSTSSASAVTVPLDPPARTVNDRTETRTAFGGNVVVVATGAVVVVVVVVVGVVVVVVVAKGGAVVVVVGGGGAVVVVGVTVVAGTVVVVDATPGVVAEPVSTYRPTLA
jgi:hypothetical protein